jgi:hypothetical protein
MANETSTLAATVAAQAEPEFEVSEFDATIRGRQFTFISIPHKIVTKEGNTRIERTQAFYVPKVDGLEGKTEFANWLLGQHDEVEKESGTKVMDKLIFRLLEPANERLYNDAGEPQPDEFVNTLLRPQSRSGTGIGAIKKKLAEESMRVTELYLITREKDKAIQDKMIAAAGMTSIGQVLAALDTVTQRTVELTRQLTARTVEAEKREKKKLEKAQEMLAAAQKTVDEAAQTESATA